MVLPNVHIKDVDCGAIFFLSLSQELWLFEDIKRPGHKRPGHKHPGHKRPGHNKRPPTEDIIYIHVLGAYTYVRFEHSQVLIFFDSENRLICTQGDHISKDKNLVNYPCNMYHQAGVSMVLARPLAAIRGFPGHPLQSQGVP